MGAYSPTWFFVYIIVLIVKTIHPKQKKYVSEFGMIVPQYFIVVLRV